MFVSTAVLAHQGGWDEILLVVGPLAAIAALLVVARRRVAKLPPRPEPTESESETESVPGAGE